MKKLATSVAAIFLSTCILSTGMIANAAENYTVKEGDYLKKIARTIYGDETKWETIYEANKNIIKNPNLIYKGQIFVIPDVEAVAVVPETPATPAAVPVETAEAAADTSADVSTAVIPQVTGKVLNINLEGDPKSHVVEVDFKTAPDAEWIAVTPTSSTPTVPMSERDIDLFYIGTLENFSLPDNYLEIRVKAVLANGKMDEEEYTWTEAGRLTDIPSGSDCVILFDHIAGAIFIDYYYEGVKIDSNYL